MTVPAGRVMFLFTNAPIGPRETAAPARTSAANGEVVEAIREGAQTSGVGFDYLLATAQRESSLNPSAKASTSTATGLFQFIEQTWLGVMKNAGPKLGLASYADAITASADGRYTVADPAARQAILDLRRDPKVSAAMAGALTQRNGEALSAALGREPSAGDLYAAHVLGAKGASALIASAQATPSRPAALDLPEAAAANRHKHIIHVAPLLRELKPDSALTGNDQLIIIRRDKGKTLSLGAVDRIAVSFIKVVAVQIDITT